MNGVIRTLRGALLLIFASLFAVSFWESWARLADAARLAKVPHPGPWPWAVDGFVLVLVLLVVLGALEGRKPWLPRVGIVGMTALSAAVSVLYTPEDAVGRWHAAYFVSAWPPVGAWLSFEGLMWLLFARRAEAAPEAAQEHADSTQEAPHSEPHQAPHGDRTDAPIPPAVLPRKVRPPSTQERAKIDRRRGSMSGRRIAGETGIPEKVVAAYLRAQTAPEPAAVVSNGQGAPVAD